MWWRLDMAIAFVQSVGNSILENITRNFKDAASGQRNLSVAYVSLYRPVEEKDIEEKNGIKEKDSIEEKNSIGVFVPELYLMAKAGFLPAQIKAQRIRDRQVSTTAEDVSVLRDKHKALYNVLYHANTGKLKTPFELAIINSNDNMYIANQLQNTYTWVRKNGYDWPNSVAKSRIETDYLANLSEINLKVSGKKSASFTVDNPPNHTKTHEKILHFIASWIAPLLTMSAFFMMYGVYALPGLLLFSVYTYLVTKSADESSMHSFAEKLSRELGWLKFKEYRNGELSWLNAFHAGFLLAVVAFACTLAAKGAWIGIISMPLLQSVPQVGMLLAGFFAGVAALTTFISVSSGIRCAQGMSVYDNQIRFAQGEGQDLPMVTPEGEKRKRRSMKGKEATAPDFHKERIGIDLYKETTEADFNDAMNGSGPFLTPNYLNKASDRVMNQSAPDCFENKTDSSNAFRSMCNQ